MRPEIRAIVTELEWERGCFPRDAIKSAVRAGSEIADPLIESLRYVVRCNGDVPDEYVLHLCAMFVLAEMGERRAYQPLVELCRLGDGEVWGLLGDVVTEQLAQVLASVAQADDSLLRALVVDEDVGAAVRAAALHAMACSAVEGVLERDRFRGYLGALLRGEVVPRHAGWVWDEGVAIAVDLGFAETLPDILRAFDEGLLQPLAMRRDEAEQELTAEREAFKSRGVERYSFVRDAVAELERWRTCWEPRTKSTTRMATPAVGRNEPCSCGSGKKYKKCCGYMGGTGVRTTG